MPAITPTDLTNAKTDVDKISEFMESSSPTMTTRLGATVQTRSALAATFPNAEPSAAAAEASAIAAGNSATSAAADATSASSSAAAATAASALAESYPLGAATNVPRGLTQASVGAITAGSGGTNGTFTLGWSGGNFTHNPTGTFTVSGGALTAVTITGPGLYIGSSPTVPTPSFTASAGLSGAAVALTAQFLAAAGEGYWVQSSDGKRLYRYKNVAGVATLDTAVGPITTSEGVSDIKGQQLESAVKAALAGGHGTLKALWHPDCDKTYASPDVLSTWVSADPSALSAGLHSTIYSGTDPRPVVNSRGIYFSNQAGLTVASGILADTANFGLFFAFDIEGIAATTYATKAAADAAVGGHAEGDVIKVTADTNTTHSPDVTLVLQAGFADTVLKNGYYVKTVGAWATQMISNELFAIVGTGGSYIKGYLNRLGQLVISGFSGSGGAMTLLTVGTDVLAKTGPQFAALYRDATHWRLHLNGQEIMALKSTLNITTLTTTYFNGDARGVNPANPVNGMRQYVRTFGVVDDITWQGFQGVHDAIAAYAGAQRLELPPEMWAILSSGQSWWQAATTITDVWSNADGWDGAVDRENTSFSGDHNSLTREFIPHVYAMRDQDNTDDIGPMSILLNGLGAVSASESHKAAGSGEGFEFGAMKQITRHAKAPFVDWIFCSAGAGGNTLAMLTAETSPALLVQELKSKTSAEITYLEEQYQAIVNARDFARSRGQRFRVALWDWRQGHSDMSTATYVDDFKAHYDKVNAAVKRITGQSDDVVCLIPQINYSTDGAMNRTNTGVNLDQLLLDLVDARGTRPIYCTGPVYQITNFIHSYKAGYRWYGEMFGKIAAQILFLGTAWKALRPRTYTLGANYVDILYWNTTGTTLQATTNDNNIPALIANRGYEFTDTSGGGVTISSITFPAANTVRVNLSGAPAAGDVLRYTGSANKVGNICDTDTATAYYRDQDWTTALTSGSPTYKEGSLNDLKNWACASYKVL